jgi:hypothetical protein
MEAKETIRKPGQVLPMVTAVVVVLFTLANAGANMLPSHRPTRAQLWKAEERTLIDERRDRISELQITGDRCKPVLAHELARDLVMDGRSARAYADDYEQRCGEDPVMRHWGNAPVKPW